MAGALRPIRATGKASVKNSFSIPTALAMIEVILRLKVVALDVKRVDRRNLYVDLRLERFYEN